MNNKYITNLIEAAQKGHVNSFLQLTDVYVGNVYAICLRVFVNTKIAERVTVEVLNHAWQNLKHLRGNSSFQLWLNGITVFYVLEEHRTGKYSEDLIEKKVITNNAPDLSDIKPTSDLEKLVFELPNEERIMYVLHEIIGYSATEISDLLAKYRPDEILNIMRSIRNHFIEELNF